MYFEVVGIFFYCESNFFGKASKEIGGEGGPKLPQIVFFGLKKQLSCDKK